MYNRVLKRPMFRKGGPADQGSGIMSHVEPRRNFEGGGGYFEDVPFGRLVSGVGEEANLVARSALSDVYNLAGVPLNWASQFFTGYNPGFSGEKLLGLEGKNDRIRFGSTFTPGKAKFLGFETDATPGYIYGNKDKGITTLDIGKTYEAQARQEEQAAIDREKQKQIEQNPPKVNPTKYNESDKTAPVTVADKKARIKEEAGYLKELLGQEDLGKGELALVMSAALSTPGTVSDKINAAVKLAMPLAKSKEKENKDLILKAYDAYREREKAEIAAGKATDIERRAIGIAEAKTRTLPKSVGPNGEILYKDEDGKLKSAQQLRDEQMLLNEPVSKEMQISASSIGSQSTKKDIIRIASEIEETKTNIEKLKAAGKQKEADKAQESLNGLYKKFNIYRAEPAFKMLHPSLVNLKKGGRVKLASGSEVEDLTDDTTDDTEVDKLETSQMTAQGQTTPIKPVMKLTYGELRARLPKEITNDVVQLLSMSEQALQDFAYISTQSDVSKFNVKYGVNLVLPPVG